MHSTIVLIIGSVSRCQSPHMYAIDEYYDEYDTTTKLTANNVRAVIIVITITTITFLLSLITHRHYAGKIFHSLTTKQFLILRLVLCRPSGSNSAVFLYPKQYLLFS